MKIPYPSEDQIQSSIQRICDQAPLGQRHTLLSFLRDMSRNLGFRQIFAGTWDVMLISSLIFCVVGVVSAMDLRTSTDQARHATVFLFAFSPVFLFLLFSLSLWKEVEGPAYPIKMTCFYTARHLMAFRVFCVTCLSFGAVGFYTLFLGAILKLPSLPLLCVSLSSLFLYSLLQIQAVLSLRSNLAACGMLAAWVFGNCAASRLFPGFYWALLQALPFGAWLLMDLLLVVLFCNRYDIYIRRVCYAESM